MRWGSDSYRSGESEESGKIIVMDILIISTSIIIILLADAQGEFKGGVEV